MGERAAGRASEVAALKLGLDLGMTLIDTAEMYAEGGAEEVVGEAVRGRRDGVCIVSKVYPHNASRSGVVAACERSLKRLGTDRIDLYLLHWRGSHPLAETVAGFEALKTDGKIRHWGVSNFDVADMEALVTTAGGEACVSNQVMYHLGERGIEWQLLPWQKRRGIPIMAYTPLGSDGLLANKVLAEVAKKHGVASATVALAALLRRDDVIVIPKAARPEHLRANAAAKGLTLDTADFAALDTAFPPPKGKTPLAMG
jgi:diketogulonate reductase-like aldo/keto reductase